MKFFAATLLATAALGVNLQVQAQEKPLGDELRKEIRGFVKKVAKEVDANGNGKVSANEVRKALRAAGVPTKTIKEIVSGFKEENDNKAMPINDIAKEVLDGARAAIAAGATREDVRNVLDLVANAESAGDAIETIDDAIDAVAELDNAQF